MKTRYKIMFGILLIIGLIGITIAVAPAQAFGFDRILNLSGGFAYFDKIVIGDPSASSNLNNSLEIIGNTNLSGILNVSGDTEFKSDVTISGVLKGNSPLEIHDSINITGVIMNNGTALSEIFLEELENVTIESRIDSTMDNSYIEFNENGGVVIGI